MADPPLDAVTGAFSFTGRAIAAQLLSEGRKVVALVRRPDRPNPFGPRVHAVQLRVGDSAALAASLAGVETLYNTLWIRFPRGDTTYEVATGWTLVCSPIASRAVELRAIMGDAHPVDRKGMGFVQ